MVEKNEKSYTSSFICTRSLFSRSCSSRRCPEDATTDERLDLVYANLHEPKSGDYVRASFTDLEVLFEWNHDDSAILREDLDIEVDGGVNAKTAELCSEAGANILCSGSYIFNSKDTKVAIDILRNA